MTDSTSGTFTVFIGNGSGSFKGFSASVGWGGYHQLVSAVGDIDGDGRTDLVIGDKDNDYVSVYLTEPTATATATASFAITGIGQHLVASSYSGDGNYNSSISGATSLWGLPPATTTSLAVSSGGVQVTSVPSGSVVALTGTVKVGGTALTAGQVTFCDTVLSQCGANNIVGTAVLTNGGTAVFKFVPGPGVHSYKAIFLEDGYGLSSSSAASALTVGAGKSPVYTETTSIAANGVPGNYSLTATVLGYGGTAPPTGNVSFLDTSFGNTSLGTAPLGASIRGLGWQILPTPTLGNSAISEVVGDFNGDGFSDLALLWTDNNVRAK